MRAVDTNILIHAHREEMAKHLEAAALIRQLAEGELPWGIPVFCLSEFLRVVTHHRVFNPPTPLPEALSAVESLLQSPTVHLLLPGERFWTIFTRLSLQGQVSGNLVFDAQIAALCLERGIETLITEDRDFSRFEDIQIIGI